MKGFAKLNRTVYELKNDGMTEDEIVELLENEIELLEGKRSKGRTD